MKSGICIPLITENGILVVSTETNVSTVSQQTLNDILRGSTSALIPMERKAVTSMAMNPARLSPTCYARLMHWKLGHPAEDVPMKMDSGVTVKLNEDCFVCDQSKMKVKPFPKNDPSLHSSNPPFWRTYCDGYGGGRKGALEGSSLGGESYEGAVGGFIFACASTGTLRRKLYATTTQFPAILYQFLQDVERQHFMCKELYVDTYSVNLSKEAEDVAAMFRCRICPISAGTPQELAFAESGVRNVGKISRSMLLGAKHLPSWAWGLADGYATYVHDVLPQRRRGYKSPYELRNGKKPNLDLLFVKCFGAACQYAPMEGAEHKRGKISEWGWFLGMEWPFVLV